MISSDDALLMFKKWKTEQSLIHVMFVSNSVSASFAGVVLAVDSLSLAVQIVGLKSPSQFTFTLGNAEFQYADSREAPEILKQEATKYEGCLTAMITTADDVPDKVSFFEMRLKN